MQRYKQTLKVLLAVSVSVAAPAFIGCGGAQTASSGPAAAISLSLDQSAITTLPGGSAAVVHTVSVRTNTQDPITLSVPSLPSGLVAAVTQPGSGSTGSIAFTESANGMSGVYTLTVNASTGTLSASAQLTASVSAVDAVTLIPATMPVIASQDGAPGVATITVGRSAGNANSINLMVIGLPTGLSANVTQPGIGNMGSISFTAASTPPVAGTYAVTVTATDGISSASVMQPVIVAVVEHIFNSIDTTLGVNGHLQEAMSTGFQSSIYSDAFLPAYGSSATMQLAALNSQHVRVQPILTDVPQQGNSSPQLASDWSFTALDKTVQPLLTTGDRSPGLQLATAPPFLNDANGVFIFNDANLGQLASYAANVVRYYNTGGFTWGGQHFQSASSQHITRWAIYNEPNLNGLTPAQYVRLYNTLVPAMLAVDPTLKFSTLELSGFNGQAQLFMPTLVLPSNGGGLNAQVDNVTTHFYSSCNQTDTDAALFAQVAGFTSAITYMRTELSMRGDLSGIPVWVTETNVNADYPLLNGKSACQPKQNFVSDARGSSAFFAAWRPLVFSKLGKAGNQALYQFTFDGSNQYGEVDAATDRPFLAYWVDYWLQRYFPYDPATAGAGVLRATTSERTDTVEVLATRNLDNSVSLLVCDIALANAVDNNGPGSPRTVLVDVSALGTFSTGSITVLDASTSPDAGPITSAFAPSSMLRVTLGGYGTTLIRLRP